MRSQYFRRANAFVDDPLVLRLRGSECSEATELSSLARPTAPQKSRAQAPQKSRAQARQRHSAAEAARAREAEARHDRMRGRRVAAARVREDRLPAKTRVVVHGIRHAPELNDEHATVESFDEQRGRYVVRLKNGRAIALKPGNVLEEDAEDAASSSEMFRLAHVELERGNYRLSRQMFSSLRGGGDGEGMERTHGVSFDCEVRLNAAEGREWSVCDCLGAIVASLVLFVMAHLLSHSTTPWRRILATWVLMPLAASAVLLALQIPLAAAGALGYAREQGREPQKLRALRGSVPMVSLLSTWFSAACLGGAVGRLNRVPVKFYPLKLSHGEVCGWCVSVTALVGYWGGVGGGAAMLDAALAWLARLVVGVFVAIFLLCVVKEWLMPSKR